MAQFLQWGSEDNDIFGVGGAAIDTTGGRFSPNVACGLAVNSPNGLFPLTDYWRSIGQFSSGSFMVSGYIWTDAVSTQFPAEDSSFVMRLVDSNGVPRFVITNTGVGSNLGPFILQKVSAAGVYTQLGAGFTGILASTLQRLSVFWSPTRVAVYIAAPGEPSSLIMGYTGDTTTDSVSSLAGYDLGCTSLGGSGSTGRTVWSGMVCGDFDVRSIELVKLAITGAGASSAWNGASDGSTIDELPMVITDGIDSGTANQVSLFTAPGSLPSGSWGILGVGVAALASAAPYSSMTTLPTSGDTPTGSVLPFTSTSGVANGDVVTGTDIQTGTTVVSFVANTSVTLSLPISGDVPTATNITFAAQPPQHVQMAVRIGSTTYFSGNLAPVPALDRVASVFQVSPATGQLFTPTELSGLQVGAKSIA